MRVSGNLVTSSAETFRTVLLSGGGIALAARFIVEDELRDGTLVPVLADWSAPDIWLTLYYPPYERLPLRVATFSDFFEVYVKETRPL